MSSFSHLHVKLNIKRGFCTCVWMSYDFVWLHRTFSAAAAAGLRYGPCWAVGFWGLLCQIIEVNTGRHPMQIFPESLWNMCNIHFLPHMFSAFIHCLFGSIIFPKSLKTLLAVKWLLVQVRQPLPDFTPYCQRRGELCFSVLLIKLESRFDV